MISLSEAPNVLADMGMFAGVGMTIVDRFNE